MTTKKIEVKIHLTRRPGDMGFKTELVRKTYHLPVKVIIAFARTRGVKITPEFIYNMRSTDKKKAASGSAPQLLPPTPLRLTTWKDAPKTTIKFSAFDSPTPERDFLQLVLRLGTIRANEMLSNAPTLIRKEFGIG